MLESFPFRVLILGCIVTNSFLIALQTDESYSVRWTFEFSIFDKVVLVIFVCEILLKWYYDFWVFWKSKSNILDLLIVCVLFLGPNMMMGNEKMLKILRVLRAFRSLKSISSFAGLQMVIQTILQSLPDMANIGLLLLIILIVLAVVGVTLFQNVVPNTFGDLGKALFSLFICVTQDGWITIFKDFQAKGGAYYYGGMFYFCVAIMIGSFVFANLIVAIVVTNLECSINEMKEKKKREEDVLQSLESTSSKHDFADDNIPIITATSLSHKEKINFKQQTPLQLPNFDNLNKEKLENYFLILIAIEENLKEYNLIREDMEKMYGIIQDFNLVEANDALVAPSSLAAELNEPDIDLTKGDILSNLIKLEGANLISTNNARSLDHALKKGTHRK
ncbi:cation channel sperm-associated protein 4-like [Lineus longissimus]|uniref:cation channel sperm-associated protein 4-like n=1 Tax=Lineus longissimus TaxID=88925 RepID=UPI00315CD3E0